MIEMNIRGLCAHTIPAEVLHSAAVWVFVFCFASFIILAIGSFAIHEISWTVIRIEVAAADHISYADQLQAFWYKSIGSLVYLFAFCQRR